MNATIENIFPGSPFPLPPDSLGTKLIYFMQMKMFSNRHILLGKARLRAMQTNSGVRLRPHRRTEDLHIIANMKQDSAIVIGYIMGTLTNRYSVIQMGGDPGHEIGQY